MSKNTKIIGEAKKVSGEWLVDPKEIFVDESLNGRAYSHDDETVLKRVESFKELGQLTACEVMLDEPEKDDSGKVIGYKVRLVFGYCRWKAAMKYNEIYPDDPKFMLRVRLSDVETEEQALLRNIAENVQREGVTVIDLAKTQQKLRQMDYNDTAISKVYGCTSAYVGQLKRLLELPEDIQKLIHKGQLSMGAGLKMVTGLKDSSQEKKEEIYTDVIRLAEESDKDAKEGKVVKIKTAKVFDKLREKQKETGKKTARTLSEVKDFLDGMTGAAYKKGSQELALKFLAFIGGEIDEGELVDFVEGCFKK